MYDEDVFLEDKLFPWLSDGCMSDECIEPIEEGYDDDPWYSCKHCGADLDDIDESASSCPDCEMPFSPDP